MLNPLIYFTFYSVDGAFRLTHLGINKFNWVAMDDFGATWNLISEQEAIPAI